MAFDHRDVVEVFLKTLLEKRPELRQEMPSDLEALKDTMTAMLKLIKPDINQYDLRDPESLKQLSVALVTSLSIHKLSLDPNKNYLNKIQLLFDGKKIDGKSLLDHLKDPDFNPQLAPQLFDKYLSPEEKKQLQQLMQKTCEEVFNDLQRLDLFELKPGVDPAQASKEISEKTEAFINLYGMMGGIVVPVPIFNGNLFGIPDLNPYPGTAQIDLINRVDDNQQGDPLGLNAIAEANYAKISGNPFAESYREDLGAGGIDLIDHFYEELKAERLISTPSFKPAEKPPGG